MSEAKFWESRSTELASDKTCPGFRVSSFHNLQPLSYTEESVEGKSAERLCEAAGGYRQDCVDFSPPKSLESSRQLFFL